MNASHSISYTDEAYTKIKRKNNKSPFVCLHIYTSMYTHTQTDTLWTKRTHDEILDKRKEIVTIGLVMICLSAMPAELILSEKETILSFLCQSPKVSQY
jgi:hypothetical protein